MCIWQCRFDIVLVLLAGSKHKHTNAKPQEMFFNSKDKVNNIKTVEYSYSVFCLCMEGNETV